MKRTVINSLSVLSLMLLVAPAAQAANPNATLKSEVTEHRETSYASKRSGSTLEAEKRLSGRFREEFYEGLGNKGDSSSRIREEFYEGLGNKGDSSSRTIEEFYEGLGNKGSLSTEVVESF